MGVDELPISDETALIALACVALAIAIALVFLLTSGKWDPPEHRATDAVPDEDADSFEDDFDDDVEDVEDVEDIADIADETPAETGEPAYGEHVSVRVRHVPAHSDQALITRYRDCPLVLDAERLYVDKRWTPPDDDPLIRCADRRAFLTDFEPGDWVQEHVNALDLLAVHFSDYAFQLHRTRALSPDIEARLSAHSVDLWLKRQATYAKFRYEDGASHEVLFYPCVEVGPADAVTAEARSWLGTGHLLAEAEDGPYAAPDFAEEHASMEAAETGPETEPGEASPEEALSAVSAQLNALQTHGAEVSPATRNRSNGPLSTPRAATSALLGALHCEIVPLRHMVNVTFELVNCQKVEGLYLVETRQRICDPGAQGSPRRELLLNRYHYFLPAPGGGLLVRMTLPDVEDGEASAMWLAGWLASLRVVLPSTAPITRPDAAEPAPALT